MGLKIFGDEYIFSNMVNICDILSFVLPYFIPFFLLFEQFEFTDKVFVQTRLRDQFSYLIVNVLLHLSF